LLASSTDLKAHQSCNSGCRRHAHRRCCRPAAQRAGGVVSAANEGVRLSDEQRLDWLRLIRSEMSARAHSAR
jgi:hypothetical protein